MNSEDAETIASHQPYSITELIERFERGNGTGRYLLILYSIAIGLNAKTIVDIGTGQTTGALRTAAKKTGGIVELIPPTVSFLTLFVVVQKAEHVIAVVEAL